MNTLEQNVFVSTAPRLNQSHVPARPHSLDQESAKKSDPRYEEVGMQEHLLANLDLARTSLNPHKYHLKDVLNTMGRNIYICQQCQGGPKAYSGRIFKPILL